MHTRKFKKNKHLHFTLHLFLNQANVYVLPFWLFLSHYHHNHLNRLHFRYYRSHKQYKEFKVVSTGTQNNHYCSGWSKTGFTQTLSLMKYNEVYFTFLYNVMSYRIRLRNIWWDFIQKCIHKSWFYLLALSDLFLFYLFPLTLDFPCVGCWKRTCRGKNLDLWSFKKKFFAISTIASVNLVFYYQKQGGIRLLKLLNVSCESMGTNHQCLCITKACIALSVQ